MSILKNPQFNVRQSLCESSFQFTGRECKWSDVVCLIQMSKNRVARIELSDRGYSEHYSQLIVEIIHTVNGKIDEKSFHFSDWIAERDDTRGNGRDSSIHVWRNNGQFAWYCATPTKAALKTLTDAVVSYIKAFE